MKAKLNKTAQAIAAAGADDNSRPVLNNICVRKGKAIAGNGFILATAPVDVEGDEGRDILIPIDLIAALQAASPLAKKIGIEVEEKSAEIRGSVVSADDLVEATAPRKEWAFPNYEAMIPHTDAKAFISFSGGLLKQLVKVIGDETVYFRIRQPNEPVEFIAGDIHGIIMPLSTNDSDVKWW